MAIDGNSPPSLEELRVNVTTLRRRGQDRSNITAELPATWISAVLAETDAEVRDLGHAELEIILPADGPVIVSGRLSVVFEVQCGRCLEPATIRARPRVQATFFVGEISAQSTEEDEEGLILAGDALDMWTFDGAALDLTSVVAEHINVAYPMRALCGLGEGCQGLCSGCGANFNTDPPERRKCRKCGQESLGPTAKTDSEDGSDPKKDGPMADALRKLRLSD